MKKVILSSALLIVLILSGTLAALYYYGPSSQERYQTNREFRQWKKGTTPELYSHALTFIGADKKFRLSLHGKTIAELKNWFPDLRAPSASNEHQMYYKNQIEHLEFYWIGDSNWGLECSDGVLKQFRLLKG